MHPSGRLWTVARLQAHQGLSPCGLGKGSLVGDGVADPSEEKDHDDLEENKKEEDEEA